MNVFELTRQLIDIPSVTGEELAVGQFLVATSGAARVSR